MEVSHKLRNLKVEYNRVCEDNTRHKTKNCQLEVLVTALHEDLKI